MSRYFTNWKKATYVTGEKNAKLRKFGYMTGVMETVFQLLVTCEISVAMFQQIPIANICV